MATNSQQGGPLTCGSGNIIYCHKSEADRNDVIHNGHEPSNADGMFSPVLSIIAEFREKWEKVAAVGDLKADADTKFKREKFEIVAAKRLVLDELKERVQLLPNTPGNLTVEKPSLHLMLLDAHAMCSALKGQLCCQPLDRQIDEEWHLFDRISGDLECALKRISGSAEEQPLNSEEAPATGKIPVTPGPNLPEYFDALSVADLHQISELALEAMERRPGAEYEWTVADRFREAVKVTSGQR